MVLITRIFYDIEKAFRKKDASVDLPLIAIYDKNCSYRVTEGKDEKMFRFGIREELFKESVIMNKEHEFKASN